MYDVVITDARSPRDGRFIEKVGTYNPNTNPATFAIDDEATLEWLLNGAQPSDTVRSLLSQRGIMLRKHLEVGVRKGAITEEQAQEKFQEWKSTKDEKLTGQLKDIVAKKEAEAKAKLEAEAKINQARVDELKKKKEAEEAALAEAEKAKAEEEAAKEAAQKEAAEQMKQDQGSEENKEGGE